MFIRFYLSQTDDSAGMQNLKCSGKMTVLPFFYTLGIKEGINRKLNEGGRREDEDWITG